MALSELFFTEQVAPLLKKYNSNLKVAAGRLDYGSDVLGYDTDLSSDHAWGPQVTLWLSESDLALHREALDVFLQERLPPLCHNYKTRMTTDPIWHPAENGHHRVRFESIASFFEKELGLQPGSKLSPAEWLSLPAQKLRVIASGKIFVDEFETKELTTMKERLA